MLLRQSAFLLQHLPEPNLPLILSQDQIRLHSDLETLFISALLTLFPILVGDVTIAILLTGIRGWVCILTVGPPEECPTAEACHGAIMNMMVVTLHQAHSANGHRFGFLHLGSIVTLTAGGRGRSGGGVEETLTSGESGVP